MKRRTFTLFLSITMLFTMNSFVFAAPSASVMVESCEETAPFYTASDKENADTYSASCNENLLIPVDKYSEPTYTLNSQTGKYNWNIYALVDGEVKSVPIKTDGIYPQIIESGKVTESYLDKLCTYSVDSDGVYTITSLGYAQDADGNYEGIVKNPSDFSSGSGLDNDYDESIQFYAESQSVDFMKIAGTRYRLDGLDEAVPFLYVAITPYTRIIIKNYIPLKNTYEYLVFDYDTYMGSDNDLTNVSLVVSNDINTTSRENLEVLYAEATEFEMYRVQDPFYRRIISSSEPTVDKYGYYRNLYNVFNPYTGKKEEIQGIFKTTSQSALSSHGATKTGCVIDLFGDEVDDRDTEDCIGILDAEINNGLVWITKYNSANKLIKVVPVNGEGITTWEDAEGYTSNGFDTDLAGSEFPVTDSGDLVYKITDNTKVVMLKSADRNENLTRWGLMTLLDSSALSSAVNTYKCYNGKILDSNGLYKTYYSRYVKAHISLADSYSSEGLYEVDYVVIIVNGNEPENYLDKGTSAVPEINITNASVSDNKLSVNTLANFESEVTFVAAVFRNSRFVGCVSKKVVTVNGNNSVIITGLNLQSGDVVKTMILDDFAVNKLSPMCKAFDVTVE